MCRSCPIIHMFQVRNYSSNLNKIWYDSVPNAVGQCRGIGPLEKEEKLPCALHNFTYKKTNGSKTGRLSHLDVHFCELAKYGRILFQYVFVLLLRFLVNGSIPRQKQKYKNLSTIFLFWLHYCGF
jgi:hypothetical protein